MKKSIYFIITLLSISFMVSANTEFSTKCIEHWDSPSEDYKRACENITHSTGADCVKALKSGNTDMIRACAQVDSNFGVSCVKAWNKPSSDTIKACAQVNSQFSSDCITAIKSGTTDNIKACGKIKNQFSSSCVSQWADPNYDMIVACQSIRTQFSADCIGLLKKGNSDTIYSCANVKDDIGIDCIKRSENLTNDQIRFCAMASRLPDTHADCYNCSSDQRERNQKILSDYADASKKKQEEFRALLESINGTKFLENKKNQELWTACVMDNMTTMFEETCYIISRNATPKELPDSTKCSLVAKKFQEFQNGKEVKEKKGFFNSLLK